MNKPVAQTELQCPACAGQRVWSPEAQALECNSCGMSETPRLARNHQADREIPLDPKNVADDPLLFHHVLTHECETCGGEITFAGPALSNRCGYCNGPVVIKHVEESYETTSLIPFAIARPEALGNVANWVKTRKVAPNDLQEAVINGQLVGLYVPFWTFDSREMVNFTGKRSLPSARAVGPIPPVESDQVSGSFEMTFDDLLIAASPHITPMIRDGVIHDFNPDDLRPYDPAYLSGFGAERHHQSLSEGLEENWTEIEFLIRDKIERITGGIRVDPGKLRSMTSGMRYRRILLPVWILHYSYNGNPAKIVVCGLSSRTFGERPISQRKLQVYGALLSFVVLALGFFFGALFAT